ncbi:hypothetical protein [Butyrivibrio sp. MB2005]|uniref:hypothetical protein n=1 Tax=Butyrivibrio sp. MB2005 TaxID=1280678 RepID=UPI00047EF254|nr:hypothetical protein [Butyrivibrio sp. MB2005]
MCKFCSREKEVDSDFLDKQIFMEDIEAGFLGSLCFMGSIDPDTKSLRMAVVNNEGDAKEYSKSIKYCPFCGEKL